MLADPVDLLRCDIDPQLRAVEFAVARKDHQLWAYPDLPSCRVNSDVAGIEQAVNVPTE
jgi:hypothetical protein